MTCTKGACLEGYGAAATSHSTSVGSRCAGPAGKGVGLVIADMADRRGGIERPEAVKAHLHETAVGLFPIERGGPALRCHHGPAVGKPERGRAVAAVLDEGDPLGIGDAAIGEPEGTDELIVSRPFIVKAKPSPSWPTGTMPPSNATQSSGAVSVDRDTWR